MQNRSAIVYEALQIHGGIRYICADMYGMPVEGLYRDVRLMRIVEGTSEIQMHIIGRSLFTDMRQSTLNQSSVPDTLLVIYQ